MSNSLLLRNQNKRRSFPLWMLLCFSMFCFWQMGFIYFIGPSLTLDGKTPLPISTDNIAVLIMGAYVVSLAIMIFIPYKVITAGRICTAVAILTLSGMFLPLDADALRLLIYIHEFVCCVMIGFETFIIVNFFSEDCTIKHLTLAYGFSLVLIALVQNDFVPITFEVFRNIIIFGLVLLLIFYIKLPSAKDSYPVYVKKDDNFITPKKLLAGAYILIFASALMAVSGPAISGEVEHGVFITYISDAVAGFIIYILYKKAKIHPFLSISICIALGSLGFLAMYIAAQIPAAAYLSCVLIGIGMLPCQLIPLYCVMMMKSYPSKFLAPASIFLALIAVFVQSTMVDIFRDIPVMLNLAYCVIMIVLVFIYMYLEPYFLYSFKRNISDHVENKIPAPAQEITKAQTEEAPRPQISEEEAVTNMNERELTLSAKDSEILATLTKREFEVLDLIGCGYSNSEIAKALFISEHTVNDYTKKIYRKLDVHSRYAAAQFVNKK